VASSPEAGPRHVGRVIDPTAREDGEAEPDLQLDPAFAEERAATPKHEGPARGQAVRERLLARAAEAGRGPSPVPPAAASSPAPEAEPSAAAPSSEEPAQDLPRPAVSSLDLELELIAGRESDADRRPARLQQLSPNMLALLGTLLGLATVSSLVALGIHLDKRAPQIASAGAPVESAQLAASAAPAAPVAPPVSPRARQKVPGPWRIRDATAQAESRIIEGQIGLKPFLKALNEAGVPSKESYRVLKVLGGLTNLDNCGKSDRFLALLERASQRLTAFEYIVNAEEVYQARQDGSGILVGKKLDLKVERAQVRGAFAVDAGGVERSATQAGFDPGLSKVLAKAVDGHISLDELERGDLVRVVAQEVAVLGEFSRYAGIEALEIKFSDRERKPLRIYYFQGPRSRGYFDAGGRSPYEGGWRKPVKDGVVTSKFNPKRMHPVLKKTMPHNGTDFGAPTGTPALASSFGTVTFIGYSGPSGNLVKVEHPGGVTTGYAHLSRFVEGLRVGDKVKRQQVVGFVGSTGRSTGPHLHFSAEKDDRFFDAESLNLDGMRVLPSDERAPFAGARGRYDAQLDAIPLPAALAPLEPAPSTAANAPAPKRTRRTARQLQNRRRSALRRRLQPSRLLRRPAPRHARPYT